MGKHRVRIPVEVEIGPLLEGQAKRWRDDYAVFSVEAVDATEAASLVAMAIGSLVGVAAALET